MSIWRLILQELRFRKLNFALALLSVVVVIGAGFGLRANLRQYEIRSEERAQERAERMEQQKNLELDAQQERLKSAKGLEDYLRKVTKQLGFNIRILPKNINFGKLEDTGEIDADMPEEYVGKLADSGILSINHLLPILQQRVLLPELGFHVLVVGTRGEVPFKDRELKKPLLDRVPRGGIILGHNVHTALSQKRGIDIGKGYKVTLKGEDFEVLELNKRRGDRNDNTVFINLEQAQELFEKQGRINAILALGCNCEADRLTVIQRDIQTELPGTTVDEMTIKADARARARLEAARRARAEALATSERTAELQSRLETEARDQAEGRRELESLNAKAIPALVVLGATWLAVLILLNVRDRREEIGIFRALGLRFGQILLLFLGKAFLIGLLGAVLGIGLGIAIHGYFLDGDLSVVLDPMLLLFILLFAPLLCLIAGWLPALLAARQDPAVILREN